MTGLLLLPRRIVLKARSYRASAKLDAVMEAKAPSRRQTATYRAVLRGDRLEWRDEAPPEVVGSLALPVSVTILRDEPFSAAQAGERMAAALEKLAASQSVAGIEDPVAWQRETRRDRPLPGRD
jgi:hypothetical protein